MRQYLLFAAAFTLIGCSNRSTSTQTTATDTTGTAQTDAVAKTYCFRQVTGRDSVTARLVMNGADVTGELAVLPYEKDRARGPIRGTLTNNQIRADWQRSGEGVTQPHELVFTLTDSVLTWREGERVEKQGKWVLRDPNAGFQYKLTRTECP
ncbi:MAG: hypothetical protein H7Z72_03250 [Bacteroidetes bacterium]|nr:hypothetical protein [Fibrella sp.]